MAARVVCSCGWNKRYTSPAAAEFNARRHVCAKADGAILDEQASQRTARRLQALVALGWSMSKIAQRLDINWAGNACPIIKGERRLTVATARKADQLFEELCMTLPPETNQRERIAASRARRYARDRGWLTPLALDDLDDQADPDDEPAMDEVAIQRRMSGDKTVRLTAAERSELVARWSRSGRPLAELERVAGINPHRSLARRSEETA